MSSKIKFWPPNHFENSYLPLASSCELLTFPSSFTGVVSLGTRSLFTCSTTSLRWTMNLLSFWANTSYRPISWFPSYFPPPIFWSMYKTSPLIISCLACRLWLFKSLLYLPYYFSSVFLLAASVSSISSKIYARWSTSKVRLLFFSPLRLNSCVGFVKTNSKGACTVLRCMVKLYAYVKAWTYLSQWRWWSAT